jgi:predicted secreted protein
MAKPTTLSAAKLSIWVGDGASPEVFAAPCGLTTRGINFSKNTNEVSVPDCDDPDAPAWVERVARDLQAGVTGSGVLALEALDTWWNFFKNPDAQNCRIVLDDAAAGRWNGAFQCTGFNVTGSLGDKVQVELTLASDGEVTWTDAV